MSDDPDPVAALGLIALETDADPLDVAALLDPDSDALVSEAGVVIDEVDSLLDSLDELDSDPEEEALEDCDAIAQPFAQIACPAVDQFCPGKIVPLVSSWKGGMMSPQDVCGFSGSKTGPVWSPCPLR